MADGSRYSMSEFGSNSPYFERSVISHHQSECCQCTLLEDQLKEVLDELTSSKLIIKVLYEEISSSK
jgi:hypothetical protein